MRDLDLELGVGWKPYVGYNRIRVKDKGIKEQTETRLRHC